VCDTLPLQTVCQLNADNTVNRLRIRVIPAAFREVRVVGHDHPVVVQQVAGNRLVVWGDAEAEVVPLHDRDIYGIRGVTALCVPIVNDGFRFLTIDEVRQAWHNDAIDWDRLNFEAYLALCRVASNSGPEAVPMLDIRDLRRNPHA
jgi:hypothetical protein